MFVLFVMRSYLIEVRGLKHPVMTDKTYRDYVVSYRGTWVETIMVGSSINVKAVVSYRGTWIETWL